MYGKVESERGRGRERERRREKEREWGRNLIQGKYVALIQEKEVVYSPVVV